MTDYLSIIARGTLRFQRTLEAPIDKVWAYLTEPELRARWFAGGEMEPQAGGKADLVFHNSELSDAPVPDRFQKYESMKATSVITRFDPPHALAFKFGGEDAEVLFELEPDGDRTRLTLTHSGLGGRAGMIDVSGGWHAHVALLEDILAGRPRREFWAEVAAAEAEAERRIPEDA